MTRKPVLAFAIVCVIAMAALAAYLFQVGSRERKSPQTASAIENPPRPGRDADIATPASTAMPAPALDTPSSGIGPDTSSPSSTNGVPAAHPAPATPGPRLFFRHNGVESHYGSLAWVD